MSAAGGGQWEYVRGRSSKNKNAGTAGGDSKLSKAQKKKLAENMPRIEPLAPLKESSTLYDALQEKEEPKKPAAPPPPKPAKKPAPPPSKKKAAKEGGGAQSTTNLKTLLNQVPASEVTQLVTAVKTKFPTSPLLWSKDLVAYLNTRLEGAHNTLPPFEGHPSGFPLSELSAGVRRQLEDVAVTGLSDEARALLWEHCQSGMLQALSSSASPSASSGVLGYLACLQMLASKQPHLVTDALPKLVQLRSQHQGRPAACLAVLWAASQAGLNSLAAGLTVWQQLLMPVVGTRAYAAYAVDSLSSLLTRHQAILADDGRCAAEARGCGLGVCALFPLLDLVHGGSRLPLSPERERTLRGLYPRVRQLCYAAESPRSAYFPSYLRRLGSGRPVLDSEVLSSLEECLTKDSECVSVWRQLFTRQAAQSARLLQHLVAGDSWRRLPRPTQRRLYATLASWQHISADEPALKDALAQCQVLERKMGGQGVPWGRLLAATLALGVASLVFWDVRVQHDGRFERSKTHTLLKDAGLLTAWNKGSAQAVVYWHHGSKWASENVPVWYAEVVRVIGPPLETAWEGLAKVAVTAWHGSEAFRTQLLKHTHGLLLWGNEWVPVCLSSVLGAAHEAWALAGGCLAWLLTHLVTGAHLLADWVTQHLLTGSWSPEKLQSQAGVLVQSLQQQAQAAYHWVVDRLGSAQ